MKDSKNKYNVNIGFFGLLTILFIGLKLTGHIAWSWVWVLSPLWGPIFLAMIIAGLIVAIKVFLEYKG